MAVYNEILAGRFNRALQKLFGMKGPPPVPQLGSEILPVHAFANGVEHRFLESWQKYAFNFILAAGGAGNVGVVQLTNPAGSGMIVVLEKITFGNNTAAVIRSQIGFQANGLADLSSVQNFGNVGLDFRGQAAPMLRGTFKNNTAAAGGGTVIYGAIHPSNTSLDVIQTEYQEIPLAPTSSVSLFTSQANVEFDVLVWWRERVIEESERI